MGVYSSFSDKPGDISKPVQKQVEESHSSTSEEIEDKVAQGLKEDPQTIGTAKMKVEKNDIERDVSISTSKLDEKEEMTNYLKDQMESMKFSILNDVSDEDKQYLASILRDNWLGVVNILVPISGLLIFLLYSLFTIQIKNNERLEIELLSRKEALYVEVPYIGQIFPFHLVLLILILKQISFYLNYKKQDNLDMFQQNGYLGIIQRLKNLFKYYYGAVNLFFDDFSFIIFGIGIYALLSNFIALFF
ncbi:hypothetical protein K502DRAFT_324790 [Neoconidiobolus thromboides FSU 785]|nr:hypothetical protein K502DRAFT_324790 [Neoconidiobolus thromboides FSU 785]